MKVYSKLKLGLGALLLSGCGLIGELSERIGNNLLVKQDKRACEADPTCIATPPLWTADLHADTLLWQREVWEPLPEQRKISHLNTSLLRKGNANLQVFAVTTHTPWPRAAGEPDECALATDLDTQMLLKLFEIHKNPLRLFSVRQRGLGQIARFRDWLAEPKSQLTPIAAPTDLANLSTTGKIGGLLAIEGLNWIEGTPGRIDREIGLLARSGVRMASLTHRFNNALAASSEDCLLVRGGKDTGLTDAGRAALRSLVRNGMIVDLAHASPQTIASVIEILEDMQREAKAGARSVPGRQILPVVSHGGVARICPGARNLSADNIRKIIMAGGVIGVGYWRKALCFRGDTLEPNYRHFALSLIGIAQAVRDETFRKRYLDKWGTPLDPLNHVALGSDFDGAVPMYFDVGDVPDLLTWLGSRDCDQLGLQPDKDKKNKGNPKEVQDQKALLEICNAPYDSAGPMFPLGTQASGDTPSPLARLAGENVRRLLAETLPE